MENKKIEFGRTYIIVSHPKHKGLVGRTLTVTKESKQAGYVNGFLHHQKKGTPQGTEIAIQVDNIELVGQLAIIPKPVKTPVVTPAVIYLPGPVEEVKTKSRKSSKSKVV